MAPNGGVAPSATAELRIAASIVSTADVRRLLRELQSLDEAFDTLRLRGTAPIAKLPRLAPQLEAFASTNRLNLLQATERQQALAFLDSTLKHAPVLHISFAAEPSRPFITHIVTWLRLHIHQTVLVEVGLMPNIAAGCVIRTTNRVFDFSLRRHLDQSRSLLAEAIAQVGKS